MIHQKCFEMLWNPSNIVYSIENRSFLFKDWKNICSQWRWYWRFTNITNHKLIVFHFSKKCIKNRSNFSKITTTPSETNQRRSMCLPKNPQNIGYKSGILLFVNWNRMKRRGGELRNNKNRQREVENGKISDNSESHKKPTTQTQAHTHKR